MCFHESFNTQIILECGFRISCSNLQPDKRFFRFSLISASVRKLQLVFLKRFHHFKVEDSNMKYNFQIYSSDYDLNVKTFDKTAFFKLTSGDGKEIISDQIIKNLLIE